MKIKPVADNIYLKVEEPEAGVLNLSSRLSAVEIGEVIALGEKVTLPLKIGDKVQFKSWAVDIVNIDEKRYHYVSEFTGGIKAIVK